MKDKYLPIGTVVLLNDESKKIMITSYLVFSTNEADIKEMYDYGGCTFPEGIVESNYSINFNHSDIKEIVQMGHEDQEQASLNEMLKKNAEEIRKNFINETDK